MMRRVIAVELRHEDGTAGVYRDERGVWLSGMLEQGGGTLIEGSRPAGEGIPQARSGGRFGFGGCGEGGRRARANVNGLH
jgi:hypothetical protein